MLCQNMFRNPSMQLAKMSHLRFYYTYQSLTANYML